MKAYLAAASAAAMLLAGGSAGATELHKEGMTVKEVQAWLLDSGYKAEVKKNDGDDFIKSASDGVDFEVHFYDCKKDRCASVQMIAGFDVDKPMTAEQANAWNSEKRFVDCFLDDEGDPWFSYDISLSPGGTRAALDDDFSVWLSFMPDMKQHIGW